ncbi:MAG: hypothetical protein ACRDTV_13255, partial [Mycobacterium sp.]
AKQNATEPDAAPAAAAAATQEQLQRRRRRREGLIDRGYRHEYLDPDSDEWFVKVAASDRGAGTLGFAGTADKAGARQAAGLATLPGDTLGSGPTMPMMPGSWDPGTDEPDPSDS